MPRMLRPLVLAMAAIAGNAGAACGYSPNDKPVYMSFDAFPVAQAAHIAEVLERQNVKATFFVGDSSSLDDDWSAWWQARAAEGHAFGARPAKVVAPAHLCAELERSAARFHTVTGRTMPKVYRPAPGKSAPALAASAEGCGWTPVGASVLRDAQPGDVVRARSLGRLEPLIVGLKARGMCFATLREHPAYRAQFAW